jgi:hypothetical protein
MQIQIPDELVTRAEKAANWYFGKDTPECQIVAIIESWCNNTEFERAKETAALNAKIKAAKEIKKEVKGKENTFGKKYKVYLTNGTDIIVYDLKEVQSGYIAYADPCHKKEITITHQEMHTREEIK